MTTPSIEPATSLKDLALAYPAAARVFEALHLDYCCGGAQTLDGACQAAGLDTDEVVARLMWSCRQDNPSPPWEQSTLTELIHHIVETHHAYTRTELARIEPLLKTVVDRHGQAHGELHELAKAYLALHAELMPHLLKEEQILFPYIEALERHHEHGTALPAACFGSIDHPIRQMNREHETAGDLLKRIRKLSNDFVPPEDACAKYRALLQALKEFEKDLMMHIHLENNLLFPRARALSGHG